MNASAPVNLNDFIGPLHKQSKFVFLNLLLLLFDYEHKISGFVFMIEMNFIRLCIIGNGLKLLLPCSASTIHLDLALKNHDHSKCQLIWIVLYV